MLEASCAVQICLGGLATGGEMIPAFGPSGALPPFVGADPVNRAHVSPYLATMTELVSRFATSVQRAQLLRGLLDYRAALASVTILQGFQWIDGSFVEDCETIRSRPPEDVDLVTFAHRPPGFGDINAWNTLVTSNLPIFHPGVAKATFKCDAYYVDLDIPPTFTVRDAAYFNGLFSHQRGTALWKGMILIDLNSDDAAARTLI